MTIVVTIKINDGIVLASDSATTFSDEKGNAVQVYNNANKIFNLVKGLPIGGFTWGAGGLGSASISTISKDLRRRLSGSDPAHLDWALRPDYTMEFVASRTRELLFELFKAAYPEKVPENFFLGYKVAGYSAGAPLPELWDVSIVGDKCPEPRLARNQSECGSNWDGEYEPLSRLILGVGTKFRDILIAEGVSAEEADSAVAKIRDKLEAPILLAAMPIQDAIDLARFMVETTIGFMRFSLGVSTVGGPIEIAAITKHEGFKWAQRKLFYTGELNP
jgi:hypothetical protein